MKTSFIELSSPLSINQQALWLEQQLYPQDISNHLHFVGLIRDFVCPHTLQMAISALAQKHECLRMIFPSVDGGPVSQLISASSIPLKRIDCTQLSTEETLSLIKTEYAIPFDLTQESPFRFYLYQRSERENYLQIVMHHIGISAEGYASIPIELAKLYQQRSNFSPDDISSPFTPYSEFIDAERGYLESAKAGQDKAFWKQYLKDLNQYSSEFQCIKTPSDKRFKSKVLQVSLPQELTQQIRCLAHNHNASFFSAITAIFSVLLKQHTKSEEVVLGVPSNLTKKQNCIGYTINTVPTRIQISGKQKMTDCIQQVSANLKQVKQHNRYPLKNILSENQSILEVRGTKLFDALVVSQRSRICSEILNFATDKCGITVNIDGFTYESVGIGCLPTGRFDLALAILETSNDCTLLFHYNSAVFEEKVVQDLQTKLLILLHQCVTQPNQVISTFDKTIAPGYPQPNSRTSPHITTNKIPNFVSTFEKNVASNPEHTAVICGHQKLSYGKLNCKANQLAHFLIGQGINRKSLIAITMNRSLDLIITLLAIKKAGAAYLPLDPTHPRLRTQQILENAKVDLLITNHKSNPITHNYQGNLIILQEIQCELNQQLKDNLRIRKSRQNLSYVIYTSGSTGSPKGVEVPEIAFDNLLLGMQQEICLSSDDRWLALTTIAFDISVLEIFLPLIQHATVILSDDATPKNPACIISAIKEHNATIIQGTASMWNMMLDWAWEKNPKLKILCGGEPLSIELAHKLLDAFENVWNVYGPTETTVWSSAKKLSKNDPTVTIGKPILNTQCYVLREDSTVTLPGIPGELYISGLGLAKGYRNNPLLTNERFVSKQLPYIGEVKLYKTGDQARYLENGEIEVLGRLDRQVKIRGHRVELGEIEANLRKIPGIHQAAAIAYLSPTKEVNIAVYYAGSLNVQDLSSILTTQIPTYMLPQSYTHLKHIPMNSNGKLDYESLPPPTQSHIKTNYTDPVTPTEKELVNIFNHFLKHDYVHVSAHFYEMGGHSLLAIRILATINNHFLINLPLHIFQDNPTIRALGKLVDQALRQSLPSSSIQHHIRYPSHTPLSDNQRYFCLAHQIQHNGSVYSIPVSLNFTGQLEYKHIERAISHIIHRHESLRTNFLEDDDGNFFQTISEIPDNPIDYIDLSQHASPHKAAKKLQESLARHPFNLSNDPLARFTFIRLSDQENILFINCHHAIFDGGSINIFLHELAELYKSYQSQQPHTLSKLKLNYRDVVLYQCTSNYVEEKNKLLDKWADTQTKRATLSYLPIDKTKLNTFDNSGALYNCSINSKQLQQLEQLARDNNCTLFILLFTLFQTTLMRYTGHHNLCIGIPISNRLSEDVQSLIGCFVNTLPIYTTSSGSLSFIEHLQQITSNLREAFEYRLVSFEKVAQKFQQQTGNNSKLFQVMFNMAPETDVFQIGDAKLDVMHVNPGTAHTDLALSIQKNHQKLTCSFEYNNSLFCRSTIKQFAKYFQQILTSVLENPKCALKNLKMLSKNELNTQVIEWNKQPISYSQNTDIISLFEDKVTQYPHQPALICCGQSQSYSEVNIQANRLAHSLLQLGFGEGDRVLVYTDRSSAFIIAVLGILKSGCSFTPVDASIPNDRLEDMISDLNPKCIVSNNTMRISCLKIPTIQLDKTAEISSNPQVFVSDTQLAYTIFTSGSTGQPKGVEIERRSINDRVNWKCAAYQLTSSDSILHTYSFIFDGAIINYLWPLCSGATIVITNKSEQYDPEKLTCLIEKYKITTMDLLPSVLSSILEYPNCSKTCHSLKNVFSGGEALPRSIVRMFYRILASGTLHNTYGPTEATVEASAWECTTKELSAVAPLGRPIAGARLYVLDQDLNVLPVGTPGELYIGGSGLARGYLNASQETNEKFISDPFNTATPGRLYRTGDLVKYDKHGNLHFLGRIDNQIKIRGFRIELEEIQEVLKHIESVGNALVQVHGSGLQRRLVAFLTLNTPQDSTKFRKLLDQALAQRLPHYMIPQEVHILDVIPRLPNGKIDQRQLLRVSRYAKTHAKIPDEKPEGKIEQQLFNIWKHLNLPTHSVTADFFHIGGNSLLAIQLVSLIKKRMHVSVLLSDIFQYSSIRSLSQFIQKRSSQKDQWSHLVPLQTKGHKTPFFCVHPIGGTVFCYKELLKSWSSERPFYALQAMGIESGQRPMNNIHTMAKQYVSEIRKIQPHGPYCIGGWSFGGIVASDIVYQLLQVGEQVQSLVLIDSTALLSDFKKTNIKNPAELLSVLTHQLDVGTKKLKNSSPKAKLLQLINRGQLTGLTTRDLNAIEKVATAHYQAIQRFLIPDLKDVRTTLIRCKRNTHTNQTLGWNQHTSNIEVITAPGDHWGITHSQMAPKYCQLIETALDHPLKIKV